MPNHLHGIVMIVNGGTEHRAPTVELNSEHTT